MRTITGKIIFPPALAVVRTARTLMEIRDLSSADVPPIALAQRHFSHPILQGNGQIPFDIEVPTVEPNRTLSLYVHVSLDGSGRVRSGDLMTTKHYAVPSSGLVLYLEIPVDFI